MIRQTLTELFERDLVRLKEEVELYNDEKTMWKIRGEIGNSGGNLVLHLIGNLNHFIGAVIGRNGYIRNREAEFSDKNISRSEIINKIDKTIEMIKSVLPQISDEEMKKDYPVGVFKSKSKMSNGFFLIHLTGHLNYHLGQINYHRRLIK